MVDEWLRAAAKGVGVAVADVAATTVAVARVVAVAHPAAAGVAATIGSAVTAVVALAAAVVVVIILAALSEAAVSSERGAIIQALFAATIGLGQKCAAAGTGAVGAPTVAARAVRLVAEQALLLATVR